ncbi:MAG TPA: hypothetical protein VD815_07195 [Candidatus Saccharimonadales bacterium]|nr:hypothetical protein [Candidatus Saccharimonadales bacterium]
MLTESIEEEKKKLIIRLRKDGVNMRNISKELHVFFSTIGKVWREREGQPEIRPEKSVTSGAFFMFEQNKSLVQVTLELDLNPTEAEGIHHSYLRLKGLDKIVIYYQRTKKAYFILFGFCCCM